jgi:hypothetical protein
MWVRFVVLSLGPLLLGLPSPVLGQTDGEDPRGSWAVSAGALAPAGEVASIADVGFAPGIAAGYHVHRLVRVDGALDVGFRGSSTKQTIQTTGGGREVQLGRQFLLRAGPSFVIPVGPPFLFSIGGGASYGWYMETIDGAERNGTIAGWSSQSRKGPGQYLALTLERMDMHDGHQVGFDLSVTVYRLRTDGESLHGLFDGEAEDWWIALGLTVAWHS